MSAVRDGDSYIFISVSGRTAMDLSGGNAGNGIPVVGWSQHMNPGGLNQVWTVKFTDKDENNYQWCKLVNQQTGTILDLSGGKAENGTQIQGWANQSSPNSQWLIYPVPGRKIPVHILYNRNASKDKVWYCADLNGGQNKDNTKITIWRAETPGTNDNQIWLLVKIN